MSILSIIPLNSGKIGRAARELLSYGTALAESAGTIPLALALGNAGEEELRSAGQQGIARLLHLPLAEAAAFDEAAAAKIIHQAALKEEAQTLLFSHDASGQMLASRLSVLLGCPFLSGVCGLPVSSAPLTFRRRVFGGKAWARMSAAQGRVVLSLSPNTFEIRTSELESKIEQLAPLESKSFSLKERKLPESGKLNLNEARIIVSGGRGMKGPEHWGPLEKLAASLGAATACSRPVADEHWRPHEEHVGQTGRTVAPDLYIACGISGAIQHLAGISGSRCIVAINKDPEAPIFEAAHYGIVGDVRQILPELERGLLLA